jgi:hypothetical protein
VTICRKSTPVEHKKKEVIEKDFLSVGDTSLINEMDGHAEPLRSIALCEADERES